MMTRTDVFWDALGALTFAELLVVAETMRDAHDATDSFELSSLHWSFLLNSARELAEDRSDEAA